MASRTQNHTLLHDIVIETKVEGGEPTEQVLKEAGSTVVCNRPKAKDLRAFDKHGDAEIAGIIELIKNCTSLGELEAENLDIDDFHALGNVLVPKSGAGQTTGESA
jgi:hypothetical protein